VPGSTSKIIGSADLFTAGKIFPINQLVSSEWINVCTFSVHFDGDGFVDLSFLEFLELRSFRVAGRNNIPYSSASSHTLTRDQGDIDVVGIR
jgi:hypothetical protein